MKKARAIAVGIAVTALVLGAVNNGRATFEVIGAPIESGSWSQSLRQNGDRGGFDRITAVIEGPGQFKTQFITPFNNDWMSGPEDDHKQASIAGQEQSYSLDFSLHFEGSWKTPLTLFLNAWHGEDLRDSCRLDWDCVEWKWTNCNGDGGTVVPEPTTLIAGGLLLLPFAGSRLRFMRRRRLE